MVEQSRLKVIHENSELYQTPLSSDAFFHFDSEHMKNVG